MFQPHSLKDAAAMHTVTEDEGKLMLRSELNQIRKGISQKHDLRNDDAILIVA